MVPVLVNGIETNRGPRASHTWSADPVTDSLVGYRTVACLVCDLEHGHPPCCLVLAEEFQREREVCIDGKL